MVSVSIGYGQISGYVVRSSPVCLTANKTPSSYASTRHSDKYDWSHGGRHLENTNSGVTWAPVADEFLKTGSAGALAVAKSEPKHHLRRHGRTSHPRQCLPRRRRLQNHRRRPRTWTHIGLANTSQIGRVRVHLRNPDIVYVCALSHMSGPNTERGIFKSENGGKTWN